MDVTRNNEPSQIQFLHTRLAVQGPAGEGGPFWIRSRPPTEPLSARQSLSVLAAPMLGKPVLPRALAEDGRIKYDSLCMGHSVDGANCAEVYNLPYAQLLGGRATSEEDSIGVESEHLGGGEPSANTRTQNSKFSDAGWPCVDRLVENCD